MAAIRLTRTHRVLIGIVVTGAVVIAGIGFAGSYAAVRTLALHKGFGWFANVFPIGVDAGIVVLLALDLLLTWLRIPFPLLRQTAWLLTAATIAFNGAAAWPDPLGVGMHAIIPVLFVVSVEAARHAIGRIADITADKHMESVRITRWVLAPVPTFRLWRRMKLWELRSYEEVIRREQDRLVYRARLRARYGVAWRRRAPIEAIMPLRLARYGVPLSETADAGLQAAGIEVQPPAKQLTAAPESVRPEPEQTREPQQTQAQEPARAQTQAQAQQAEDPRQQAQQGQQQYAQQVPQPEPVYEEPPYAEGAYYDQPYFEEQQPAWQGQQHDSPWFAAQAGYPHPQQMTQQMAAQVAQQMAQPVPPQVMVPSGPTQVRPLGNGALNGVNGNGINGGGPNGVNGRSAPQYAEPQQAAPAPEFIPEPEPEPIPAPVPVQETVFPSGLDLPDGVPTDEAYFAAYRQYVREHSDFPNARQFARYLHNFYGGTAPEERELVTTIRDMRYRFTSESDTEHIP